MLNKIERMKPEELTKLTEQELLQEEKKSKSASAVYIGLISGVIVLALLITIKQGVTFFTFFPLFFVPLAISKWMDYKAIQKEIKSRKIN